jgi:hypothetical protein
LKPGVTLEQANADVRRMIPLIDAEFGRPGPAFDRMQFGPNLQPLKEMVVGNLGDTFWLLMGTIGLLLLIACANVANLVLVRTQSRRPELSVRTALGARWSDIARVVLAEHAILGLAGGVVGVAVAYFSLPYLRTLGADDLPYIMTVRIDLTVLLAAVVMSVLATFVCAFIRRPAVCAPQTQLAESLHGTEGHEGNRARADRVRVDDSDVRHTAAGRSRLSGSVKRADVPAHAAAKYGGFGYGTRGDHPYAARDHGSARDASRGSTPSHCRRRTGELYLRAPGICVGSRRSSEGRVTMRLRGSPDGRTVDIATVGTVER